MAEQLYDQDNIECGIERLVGSNAMPYNAFDEATWTKHGLLPHYCNRCEATLEVIHLKMNNSKLINEACKKLASVLAILMGEGLNYVILQGPTLAMCYPNNTGRHIDDCLFLTGEKDVKTIKAIIMDQGVSYEVLGCDPENEHSQGLLALALKDPLTATFHDMSFFVPRPSWQYQWLINMMRMRYLEGHMRIRDLVDLTYFSRVNEVDFNREHMLHESEGRGYFHRLVVSVCHHKVGLVLEDTTWLLGDESDELVAFWSQVCDI